ncbi:hypothetical protein [Bradyrhizobium sp. HKCCYLS20291]|uniref:hypothetical protein n=1 Tax=Bradyrhizobium sp. HKCCYLS20291 TaxID=3420766 RepID=UPI003EBB6089
MIGHLKATSRLGSIAKLAASAALLSTMIFAGSATAQAASDDMVNGKYCNSWCKAYLSWSNRMLAVTQSYTRPQVRVALPQSMPQRAMEPSMPQRAMEPSMPQRTMDRAEKMDPMMQPQTKPRRPANLNSYAQFPAGSHAAAATMDRSSGDDGSAAYAGAQMGRMLAAEAPTPAIAGLRGTTAQGPDMRLVSMTDTGMTGMAQEPRTVGEASGSTRSRLPSGWIMLATGALLAYFGYGWLKRRKEAFDDIN